MPEGEYWPHLLGVLTDAQTLLPPSLRTHALLVADRAYAIPRLLDLLHLLQWHWVLRTQGQIQVRHANGTTAAALRWGIERLFLSGKSHGWDLAATAITNPVRFARLLTAVLLATWWCIAIALPVAQAHLADLIVRADQRPPRPIQLRLPLDDAPPAPVPTRPYAGKFSLFTLGFRATAGKPLQSWTPARSWRIPSWPDHPWSTLCQQVYHPPADSF